MDEQGLVRRRNAKDYHRFFLVFQTRSRAPDGRRRPAGFHIRSLPERVRDLTGGAEAVPRHL